jgi:CRISPR-associated endonuclease Csn1
MKKILGLDLGTTSIGWAFVHEAENEQEKSTIINTGVRVVPLSTDEKINFNKLNAVTAAADRTASRGARRNLQRYKLRRQELLSILQGHGFISKNDILSENFENSTYFTWKIRAHAASDPISKKELAMVFLAINKKRGYKSSRKANNQEEGQLIDGIGIAKKLIEENLTPGQFNHKLKTEGSRYLPDYYKSDLHKEFEKIWKTQSIYYPEILTDTHLKELDGRTNKATAYYFEKVMLIERAENKGKEKKLQEYEWRSDAVKQQIPLEQIAYILTELNNDINKSSGYLSAISDRSKTLQFNNLTVGQHQYAKLFGMPLASQKNQVFYRQDYLDEFNTIWELQSKHHPELTDDLKVEIRDVIIFYQRRLKSQKGLISICELESRKRTTTVDGKTITKLTGPRVAPKSSPLFQSFRIWSNINNIVVTSKTDKKQIYQLDEETKKALFKELSWRSSMTDNQFLTWLFAGSKEKVGDYEIKYGKIEGNRTNEELLNAYLKITVLEGYDINTKQDKVDVVKDVRSCFKEFGIKDSLFHFKWDLQDTTMIATQDSYELWHLLYSYEDDSSNTGLDSLNNVLIEKYGFATNHTGIMSSVTFEKDHASLSARAMRKILPYLEDGMVYSDAATAAGYNHSRSVTKEENLKRELKDQLEILTKNSLRNPIVEKILNQMINVVNAILAEPSLGRPDEIRIELARELKQTAKQRSDATTQIAKATREHEEYREIIKKEFGLPYVSKRDLIKYKLYRELKSNGYKTLYSNTYIKPDELFSKKFDIEHIIPQSIRLDDSFSNKTLELRDINIEKGSQTAIDYCQRKGYEDRFIKTVQTLATVIDGISPRKMLKLFTKIEDVSTDFNERDKNNTGYISRKANEILIDVTRNVYATSGTITSMLRSDWELIDVLKELNWSKYDTLGLTYYETNKDGQKLPKIKDWSKRNDHRHHAMDAITVAFTKPALIQYINNKSAKSKGNIIISNIEEKFTYRDKDGKRRFVKPAPDIREQSKKALASILVSHKAKNKVVTDNINIFKIKGGTIKKKQSTPRGQLHLETVYGASKFYETKIETINASFDEQKINTVSNKQQREALLSRFRESGNDSKQAFTGKNALSKNPLKLSNGDELPLKVQTVALQTRYTIRKPINADNFKDEKTIAKIIDIGSRNIVLKRFLESDKNSKAAFSNLDENPMWLNKEKGICLKTVTILGISNAVSLHVKKDMNGTPLNDPTGKEIPADFVNTGNNHHLAIYESPTGDWDDNVVSFFDAVTAVNNKQPAVAPRNEKGWLLKFSIKQNETFLIPPSEDFFKDEDLKDISNKSALSPYLFRVQKFSKLQYGNSYVREYMFRHQLETELNDKKVLNGIAFNTFKSLKPMKGIIKVRLNHLGNIVETYTK